LNRPESNSSMMTIWAVSAFEWQRRKENDELKPLMSTGIGDRAKAAAPSTTSASPTIMLTVHVVLATRASPRSVGSLLAECKSQTAPFKDYIYMQAPGDRVARSRRSAVLLKPFRPRTSHIVKLRSVTVKRDANRFS
jgi:hypothetical protein